MTTWFTSDTHWAHANIIRHCSRPFKDVREMDECMATRWNERVQPVTPTSYLEKEQLAASEIEKSAKGDQT